MDRLFREQIGFVPRVLAVQGKWEPRLPAERCLAEVAARAAAVLALSEAMAPASGEPPFYVSVEGHLKGQPRPGCLMAAEILVALGGEPERIRCWPAANRTLEEVRSFDGLRNQLGGGGLLMVTSDYHAGRVRRILRRELRGTAEIGVIPFDHSLVAGALARIPSPRAAQLNAVMARGKLHGWVRFSTLAAELAAALTTTIPALERRIATTLRGAVYPDRDPPYQPQQVQDPEIRLPAP